jgi:hypothetical protein
VTVATDALVVGGGHIAARVIMTGTGVTNVDADGLQINATANVTLSGNTDIDGGLTVLGALTLGGFPLTVEGSLLVDGANGLLRMITFGDALTVEGPAVFRGASTIGSLTHGIATFMSHFEQRSTFSGASYAPVAAHTTVLQASPTQVTFDSPGFVGTTSHFHHLRIDGLPAAIQMNTDVMVTGMLTVTAPAFGGPASFNGVGGPRNLVVSGLDVAQLNLQDVYLTAVMGSTLTRFDNVSSVNAAAAGSMVTIESNGLAAPFTMNNLSFGPAVGTMRYLTVNDLGGPAVATNIVLVGANPANGCALSAISGNASITWNGNVCF